MKANFFYVFLLATFFVGLSNVSFGQSGSGYDYVVEAGADFTLLSSDYSAEITIGVPNGGDFEMYAPTGSSGQQWDTENCGSPGGYQITTCGPGTYNMGSGQGLIDIEIIWYVELDQPGEDFFEIAGSDTTIVISDNFMAAQWGIVGESGNVNFLMSPLVPDVQYWVNTIDNANHFTYDTCTFSSATVSTYDATFMVTESGTGTAINGASVTCNSLAQTTNSSGVTVFTGLEDGSYPYSVTATGYVTASGNITVSGSNVSVAVEMSATVGTVDIIGSGVKIYPNPVGGFLHIDDAGEFNSVSVCDISGKVVYKTTVDESVTIDFAGMPGGVYFVKLKSAKELIVRKVVKQ